MKRRTGRAALAGALGLWLVAGAAPAALAAAAPVPAPAVAAPSAATRALADQLAAALTEITFRPEAVNALADRMTKALPPQWPAAWTPLLTDAAMTMARDSRGRFEQPLSDIYARRFTADELKAGVAFFTSPGGQLLMTRKINGDSSELAAPAKAQIEQAKTQLGGSAAGRSFAAKLQDTAAEVGESQQDAVRYFLPAVLVRFGQNVAAEHARTDPAPSETDQLASQIGCATFPTGQMIPTFKANLSQGMHGMFAGAPSRPDWDELMAQAVSEELDATGPRLCLELGQRLTRGFTAAEDRKALAFLSSPSGSVLRTMIAEVAAGHKPKPSSPATMQRLEHFFATPLGRKLDAGMTVARNESEAAGMAYGIAIMPGIFRRFGEKAIAKENARTPAPTPAP